MQWYGGLGIVILSLALLMGHERIARRLLGRPAEGEGVAVGIRRYARQVVGVYLMMTLLTVLLLWATGLDGFAAVAHALSAVSTGGFSTYDDSLNGMGSAAAVWIATGASLSGALALAVYYRIWDQGWRELPGDIGSTAGGVKILRLLVLLRLLQFIIRTTGAPSHAVNEPRLGGRRLSQPELVAVLSLLFMFVLVILLSWAPFLALGYDPLNSLFEVVSATATTGLSAGISGPGLDSALKGVLCLDMLAGRLEILALLVLLYPGTWFGKRM
jgi:Trk-type K+ transport system membrane component